jgi:hypothetical protein
MTKNPRKPSVVREPVQVYLAGDDVSLLFRLTTETGLSKAEILRRGLRSFGALHGGVSPMLQFVDEADAQGWGENIAAQHDDVLAEEYVAPRPKAP